MLYKEIIAVCSHIHTKRTNALWGPLSPSRTKQYGVDPRPPQWRTGD